jgi:hypothetical protein
MRAIQPTHRRRGVLAGLITGSLLAWSLLGSGAALAANPNWAAGFGADGSSQLTGQSSTSVAAGKHAGFFIWMQNNDTANISQLFLTGTSTATFSGGTFQVKDSTGVVRTGTCAAVDPLDCSIGALRSGQTVDVIVSYLINASAKDGSNVGVKFEFNTTGTPPGKNNSHGDSFDLSDSIGVSSNRDADGDFNLNDPAGLNIADNQNVSPQNPQATSASIVQLGIGGSVSEIAGTMAFCDPSLLPQPVPSWFSCSNLSSQISTVQIGNGKNFNNPNPGTTPGIQVKILFKKAPSQLTGSNPFVYHRWTDSLGVDHAELVTAPCILVGGFPSNTTPCLIVGNNAVTVWLIHNGGMRT